jgi:hypothetical protein
MLCRTENYTSYTFSWASEDMCLSQTACCPPGRIFASENIRLITSILPKEGNIYPPKNQGHRNLLDAKANLFGISRT